VEINDGATINCSYESCGKMVNKSTLQSEIPSIVTPHVTIYYSYYIIKYGHYKLEIHVPVMLILSSVNDMDFSSRIRAVFDTSRSLAYMQTGA
jgi:hypothetical protein